MDLEELISNQTERQTPLTLNKFLKYVLKHIFPFPFFLEYQK